MTPCAHVARSDITFLDNSEPAIYSREGGLICVAPLAARACDRGGPAPPLSARGSESVQTPGSPVDYRAQHRTPCAA